MKASEFDEPVKDIQGLHIVAPLLYVISCHSPHTIGFMITSHLKRTWFEASVRREPVVPDEALQPKAKTTLETKQKRPLRPRKQPCLAEIVDHPGSLYCLKLVMQKDTAGRHESCFQHRTFKAPKHQGHKSAVLELACKVPENIHGWDDHEQNHCWNHLSQ